MKLILTDSFDILRQTKFATLLTMRWITPKEALGRTEAEVVHQYFLNPQRGAEAARWLSLQYLSRERDIDILAGDMILIAPLHSNESFGLIAVPV